MASIGGKSLFERPLPYLKLLPGVFRSAFPREVQGGGRKRVWEKRDTNKERLRYKRRRKRGWKRRESRG